MPPLTKWQFYAEFAVQFALGIAYCYGMYKLSDRNPQLGWKPKPFFEKVRNKMGVGLIILAGLFSYLALPTVYHAFLDDVDVVIDHAVDKTVDDVMEGKVPNLSVDEAASEPSEVTWGEANETQHDTFLLMAAFFITLGLCCYVWNFHASKVGIGKKLLKVVGYSLVSMVPLIQPMKLHRFTWDEVQTEAVCLIIAGVCIALSHDWSKLPPPLPKNQAAAT